MNVAEALELRFEEVLEEREKSYLIMFSSTEIYWLPKSQIRILGTRLYAPEWIIKEKDLEDFVIK